MAWDGDGSPGDNAPAAIVGTQNSDSDVIAQLRVTIDHLSAALESRAVIEQAKGILMARQRCSPDTAFDMLRRASQRENRKLREIATDLVENSQAR